MWNGLDIPQPHAYQHSSFRPEEISLYHRITWHKISFQSIQSRPIVPNEFIQGRRSPSDSISISFHISLHIE